MTILDKETDELIASFDPFLDMVSKVIHTERSYSLLDL